MTSFTVAPEDINIEISGDFLSTYQLGSKIAKHHFCNRCGIYPLHETQRKPSHYRLNLGCIEAINSLGLPTEVFDGASL